MLRRFCRWSGAVHLHRKFQAACDYSSKNGSSALQSEGRVRRGVTPLLDAIGCYATEAPKLFIPLPTPPPGSGTVPDERAGQRFISGFRGMWSAAGQSHNAESLGQTEG